MRRPALALALLLAVSASASAAPTVAAEPTRVASLLPWVADALGDLEAASFRHVAAVRGSGGEPPAAGIDLGNTHAPSFELLAASRAQLVIGDHRLHLPLRERLEALGMEVLLVRSDSVPATFEALLTVARRLGTEAEMAARIAEQERALEDLRRRRPIDTLPIFGAPGTFMVITESTWLGDLLGRLGMGGPDVAGGGGRYPGYVEVSDEVLASLQPELVLLVAHGEPREVAEAFRRRTSGVSPLSGLSDVLHVLPPALFAGNPGLRMAEAARHLSALGGEDD